jgi:hypothetical protein
MDCLLPFDTETIHRRLTALFVGHGSLFVPLDPKAEARCIQLAEVSNYLGVFMTVNYRYPKG